MALGEGGIDSQVQDRMDTYRSNPKALQKAYGIGKQTIDLLALQKLNTEKKQAAAAMQAAQQQQPGTIAEQREAEALELIKAETNNSLGDLTNRTKDTLGQQATVQKKAQQRIGKPNQGGGLAALLGSGPKPPAANPQAGGLAGARMAQAAAQQGGPRRMAQGGIVGFAGNDGNNQVKSPFGRFIEPLVEPFTKEGIATQKLRQRVAKKFGAYGGVGKGLFARQTPEAREYATSVLNNLQSLDNAALLELEAADFNPLTTDLSGLPPLPTSTETETETELPPRVDGRTIDPATGLPYSPITYEAPEPYVSELSKLTNEDLNVDAVVPATPDTSGVTTAKADLLSTIGDIPDSATVEDVTKAPLEAVPSSSYLSPEGIAAENELLRRAGEDFDADPETAIDDARAKADLYSLRAEKQEISRDQQARQTEFQDRVLDPALVKKMKRMETFGGGAKYGRGGIGQGYLESERRFQDIERGGLKTLADLQQTGIANDNLMVQQGITAGESAGSRAQADRTNSATIYQNIVSRDKAMATSQQTIQQNINTANTLAQNTVNNQEYKAQLQVITNEAAARREVLRTATILQDGENNRLVAQSQNQQDALVASAANLIERAKETDKFRQDQDKIVQLDEQTARALAMDQSNMLREEYNTIINEDTNIIRLRKEVAESETEADIRDAKLRLTAYEDVLEARLASLFAFDYAKLYALEQKVAKFEQQRLQGLGGGPIDVDDPTITVDPVSQ
eukprot:GHVU01040133.1.p1 GENE.GHVU01040133.1~~GHVU01040133.1.p1  ORF type:complete len:740 (-),score=62.36 GHVU01040133.1:492-2711(-)